MARDYAQGINIINIMLRAVAAIVARDLGSDSSLPKLRNWRIRYAGLADRQSAKRDAFFKFTRPKRRRCKTRNGGQNADW